MADPIGLEGGLNLYEYGGSDPINHFDPVGLDWMDWELQGAANFAAGFGSALTLGLTDAINDWSAPGVVDKCSGAYFAGLGTGIAYGFALGGASAVSRGAPVAARGQTTVFGKLKDLSSLRKGENTLLKHLRNLGSPKGNWKQNSGVLRREMAKGRPLRDASVFPNGALRDNTGFLRAERNLLESQGWRYDPATQLWRPP